MSSLHLLTEVVWCLAIFAFAVLGFILWTAAAECRHENEHMRMSVAAYEREMRCRERIDQCPFCKRDATVYIELSPEKIDASELLRCSRCGCKAWRCPADGDEWYDEFSIPPHVIFPDSRHDKTAGIFLDMNAE